MEDPSAKRSRTEPSTAGSPSEVEILTLVSQREMYRQRQQFADSDRIRQQLRDLGVELYDKDREWKCKDGRRGVLFTAGPYECHMHETEIQTRIQEREEARRAKDWERSNVIRDELRSLGVELNDKESIWRTLHGRKGSYNAQSAVAQIPTMRGEQIVAFVAERERYREMKDYESADGVRTQLAQFGVEIFDADRMWKSADGRQGCIIPGGMELLCTFSNAEIDSRVLQREEARAGKRWADADRVRDELRANGVECLDGPKIWCTTCGRQGPYPVVRGSVGHGPIGGAIGAGSGAPLGAFAGGAIGGGGCSLPNAYVQQAVVQQVGAGLSIPGSVPGAPPFCDASIQALVNAREAFRVAHDWATADSIRKDLRAHGVEVFDKEKAWQCSDGRRGVIMGPVL